ncbi:unnamed protein product [Acanthocheilonema viteae]|uniref:Uncharacterized protein n=1 Tax=Acanthocheilonema viteae TaxID=6277 RepID=A0A498SC19_ACAVI|nr:unnamed protein product [Acanthocheilonema viteae]
MLAASDIICKSFRQQKQIWTFELIVGFFELLSSSGNKCAMATRTRYRQSTQHHSNVAEAFDAICGVSIQFARKYLYIRTDRKAIFHLLAVLVLSLFAAFVPLPNHYYFVKKNNILNSYFVKLGWFWTCVVVCPFIWFVSTAIGQSISGASSIVPLFVVFEQMTGHCHGSKLSSRTSCAIDGGKWVPGFDISGISVPRYNNSPSHSKDGIS